MTPDPMTALRDAILYARAAGDDDTADALAAMADDPDAVAEILAGDMPNPPPPA